MEEKLLEILEDKINELASKSNELKNMVEKLRDGNEDIQEIHISGLINDKKQLEEAIESEKAEYILNEYKSDLEKVNAEIDEWEQNKLNDILNIDEDVKLVENEKELVEKFKAEKQKNEEYNENLEKRKKELENRRKEAEKELSYLTKDGQKEFLGDKPIEVKECEQDLEQIAKELDEIEKEQGQENDKFKITEELYNDLCNKYNVKEILEQEQLEEKKKAEQLKLEEQEGDKKPESSSNADDIDKATNKEPDGNKPAEKKPAEKKPAEKKPAEKKPAEKKPDVNKTSNKEPVNGNRSTASPVAQNKKYIVTIGSTGKVNNNEMSTNIKDGAELNRLYKGLQINELTEKIEREYSKEVNKLIIDSYNYGAPIDFTVINTLNKSDIGLEEKEALIKGYITNILKSHYEFEKIENPEIARKLEKYKDAKRENNIEVIYDMKDLSKPPFPSKPLQFLKALFSLHPERNNLTGRDKEIIAELANKAGRYGIGKSIGQYEYNDKSFLAKIFGAFKKNRNLLPAPEKMQTVDYTNIDFTNKDKTREAMKNMSFISKEELDAAYTYNNVRDVSKTLNKKIGDALKEEYDQLKKDGKIKTAEKLKDLDDSQQKQVQNKGEKESR